MSVNKYVTNEQFNGELQSSLSGPNYNKQSSSVFTGPWELGRPTYGSPGFASSLSAIFMGIFSPLPSPLL